MLFKVLANGISPPKSATNCAYLLTDNWNDWFKYNTLYYLVVFDGQGSKHDVGGVKIGQFGMQTEQKRPKY